MKFVKASLVITLAALSFASYAQAEGNEGTVEGASFVAPGSGDCPECIANKAPGTMKGNAVKFTSMRGAYTSNTQSTKSPTKTGTSESVQ